MLCVYCGQTAYFTLKNGKQCCKQYSTQCEANRKKNAFGMQKAHANGRIPYDQLKPYHGWSRGKTIFSDERIRTTYSKEEYFCENSQVRTGAIKNIIIKEGLLECQCEKCHIANVWCDEPIVLELDHKNGNNRDNRLENLRFLCPNCHSQTKTFKGRNINTGKKKVSDSDLLFAISNQPNMHQALMSVGLSGAGNYKRVNELLDNSDKLLYK